jgi:sigma-B regulation protein RsbU (phosphoserine phosphatase)
LEVNHRPLVTVNPFYDAVWRGKPGDQVTFAVRRPGVSSPITLRATLDPVSPAPPRSPAQEFASQLLFSYQVPFVVVGLAVLFLRLDSREAWLLALMFGGFIAGSPLLIGEPLIRPALRGFAMAYVVAARGMLPAVLYSFFATFPVSSPIERHVPWLKKVILAASAVIVIPLSLWAWLEGGSRPLALVKERVGVTGTAVALVCYFFGITSLALISLVANSLSTSSAEARRKMRVILWGMLWGLGPFLAMSAVSAYTGTEYWNFPFWIWVPTALLLCLVPIAFAYAVVKHRVLEIPVLLKRSARYVLVQRGFIVALLILAAVTITLFTRLFSQFFQADSNVGMALSAVFGIVLVWASAPLVKRGTERIDRAFFRSAYDARLILEDLASRSRTATSRGDLASLLEHHVREALHPSFQLLYLETGESRRDIESTTAPPELRRLLADTPLLTNLAQRAQPYELPPGEEDTAPFSSLPVQPECLVPILGREVRLLGLLVLGQKRSEEPYSREDKQLLASAASQAGVALENIGLAEKMVERLEVENRAKQEMEIARQVQSKLLPQKMPTLRTLEYAGKCIQARAVGGDYYDFLDLGPGRVGFVLADIAGKGISAALLMANLQANLRSQYAVALQNLPQLLQSVNHLFYESTEPNNYATLFFARYDDATRRLCYINCGHNPPVLLRGHGKIERLAGTATVLGLFESWECCVSEAQLAPGDLLVIFTDGITEAIDAHNDEFGEARLLEVLRANSDREPSSLLACVVNAVQQFSAGEQSDDLTLVVARGR